MKKNNWGKLIWNKTFHYDFSCRKSEKFLYIISIFLNWMLYQKFGHMKALQTRQNSALSLYNTHDTTKQNSKPVCKYYLTWH